MATGAPTERQLKIAGVLLLVGLLVEAFFLFWTRPIGFVLFVGISGSTIGLGVVLFLLAVLSRHEDKH